VAQKGFDWDEGEVNQRLAARMQRAYGEVAERARAEHSSMPCGRL
jgi:hypothetical protein